MNRVAVIILNWNGEKLLREFLPSVLKHTNAELGRVVVVDNHSSDNSVKVMVDEFPEVQLICFDDNYGFAGGYNRAIEQVEAEYVVLLNSDVEVTPGWLEPLVALMDEKQYVAAVQPKIKDYKVKTRFEYAGACGGFIDFLGFPFCRGRILDVTEEDEGQYDWERNVHWCSGAALCIRRKVYLQVGGLDEHFFAHMEEIDLCWRIRNGGGVLKVNPASVVYHLGGGSLPMNHPHKLFLNYRNNLLMLYKNLNKNRRRVFLQRWFMDMSAVGIFALKGEMENAKAVLSAYREYRKMKSLYQPCRKKKLPLVCYSRSIVVDYYLRGRRKFSELDDM